MPIDRNQFEKGFAPKDPDHLQREILEFLAERSEQAFTCAEIVEGIGQFRPRGGDLDFVTMIEVGAYTTSITWALNDLEKKGMIASKTTADEPRLVYYIIKQHIGKWA